MTQKDLLGQSGNGKKSLDLKDERDRTQQAAQELKEAVRKRQSKAK
jgi:hypothetical protein